MSTTLEYNTQQAELRLSEYGRNVQEMVEHLLTIEDREKRTELAKTIIRVMINLNPSIKELDDYEHKLWDHLHLISDFKLDVDAPFPPAVPEQINQKPDRVPYRESLIKFRFYGRNLQNMVERAAEMEEGEMKTSFINYIASFMVNSSRNWNDEHLTPEAVVEHLKSLSKDQLSVDPEELNITIDKRQKSRGNFKSQNNFRKKKNRKRR
jgi:hypothetical protein